MAARALELCPGGELGHGLLLDRNTLLIYDIARSSAWFVNNATHVLRWLPGKKPENNLHVKFLRLMIITTVISECEYTDLELSERKKAKVFSSRKKSLHNIIAQALMRSQ